MNRLSDAEIQVLLSSMTPQQKLEFWRIWRNKLAVCRSKGTRLDDSLCSAHLSGLQRGSAPPKTRIHLQRCDRGQEKRVIINIAPRMGKSEFSSYLFPAWFLGQYPDKKIIMATHTAGLSEDFGRRVRNLIDSEEYKEVFPGTLVADDQKAAGKWSTSAGGQYYAVGVGVRWLDGVLICL